MSDPTTEAREHTEKAWTQFVQHQNLQATLPDWEAGHTPDGDPRLTVEVTGPGAAHALDLFASRYCLILGQPGDLRPAYDYSVPGRTTCVWRSGGVWVELWVDDTAPSLPEPVVPAPADPAAKGLIARASARLPYTRRPKTKEANPA